METEFYAMAQGNCDFELEVIRMRHEEHGDLMVICTEEAAIYITKEQAMKFWNLVDGV